MTAQPTIALITADAARALDEDLPPLLEALAALGATVETPSWDDAHIDWSRYAVAVLRSTWDYTQRPAEFLAWTQRAGAALHNPAEVVRWNTDKHYLAELARAGVATVPSAFVEPGQPAAAALDAFLHAHEDSAEFVVKPSIGAGSRDTQRYGADEHDAATAHIERLLQAGRSVLLQPYLEHVDEHGETALMFFDGQFSHAIRKGPLLRRGEGPTRALFAGEHITPRTPSAAEHALALRTLAAVPYAGPLLYARVDLIHDADASPRLLELELTEPSLFFAHGAESATRYARAILARAGTPPAA